MRTPFVHALTLTPHPENRTDAVRAIEAHVCRMPGGMLAVTYTLEGDFDRICIPAPAPPRFVDRLWQHTCCELFVAKGGSPAYHELNFSPSGEWAAFAFERYRDRSQLDDPAVAPQVTVRRTADTLELEARAHLEALSPAHASAALSLALSAVIEERGGALSYWALAHPPGRPDFHHPHAFALKLDEVRD